MAVFKNADEAWDVFQEVVRVLTSSEDGRARIPKSRLKVGYLITDLDLRFYFEFTGTELQIHRGYAEDEMDVILEVDSETYHKINMGKANAAMQVITNKLRFLKGSVAKVIMTQGMPVVKYYTKVVTEHGAQGVSSS